MNLPRIRLEHMPMEHKERFRLTIRIRDLTLDSSDGSIKLWLDRGDVSNLSFDCGVSLLDDDIESNELDETGT